MKLYGLIGYPLSHSFSAKYFAEKFEHEKIRDSRYQLFPIENIEMLPGIIHQFPELCGLNVTIPYKQSVISYLQKIEENAEQIGAVNTIKIIWNKGTYTLFGYNTDSFGFMESLKPHLNQKQLHALVLGTGGASKAVAYALRLMGIQVTFVSRKPFGPNQIPYRDITQSVISENKIIVNSSPVGTYPDIYSFPDIPYDLLTADHLLYDLVYNPAETEFLKRGREKGAATINGLQMLHLQADRAWEIWNS